MSHSYRKTPILAIGTKGSEARDKRDWHKRLRRNERRLLRQWRPEIEHMTVRPFEVSNTRTMAKEHRSWWVEWPDRRDKPDFRGYTRYAWWRKCMRK